MEESLPPTTSQPQMPRFRRRPVQPGADELQCGYGIQAVHRTEDPGEDKKPREGKLTMFYEDDDILVARFGTGDILVCPGHEEGTRFGTVSLMDKRDVDMNTMVRLVFEKTESIDCMIWALEEAKRVMLESSK